MSELLELTGARAAEKVRAGEVSSRELFDLYRERARSEDLNAFLVSPRGYAPGTKMTFVGLPRGTERADVIAYLNSLADSPAPLPKAAQNVPPGQKTQ